MVTKNNNEGYEELYVCMTNVADKRTSILTGIKSSLYMQQDHEKIMEIRKSKALVSKEIKSSVEEINKMYTELRKNFPNVKNILSYTEKEINELESQINTLRVNSRATKSNIILEENMKNKLENSNTNLRKMQQRADAKKVHKQEKEEEVKVDTIAPKLIPATQLHNKLSKLDRIQNNLKVIESKLKQL